MGGVGADRQKEIGKGSRRSGNWAPATGNWELAANHRPLGTGHWELGTVCKGWVLCYAGGGKVFLGLRWGRFGAILIVLVRILF